LRAAFRLAELGLCGFEDAWRTVSRGPARVLGLADRGDLLPGRRADLVVIDPATRRVAATIAGGQIAYMSGAVAERFLPQ
jgi:alpha-D-ribose 1-methylphosphonate 5-triphosphate diphosphatase